MNERVILFRRCCPHHHNWKKVVGTCLCPKFRKLAFYPWESSKAGRLVVEYFFLIRSESLSPGALPGHSAMASPINRCLPRRS
jgi:hypothetical protein